MVPVNLCQQCLIQITHFPAQPSATDAPRPDPTTLSPTRRTCITALSIMVKILLSDFRSHINHAGNLLKLIDLGRGARQGDPIASIMFVLAIEVLLISTRLHLTPFTVTLGRGYRSRYSQNTGIA